jgi:hypothetical protein
MQTLDPYEEDYQVNVSRMRTFMQSHLPTLFENLVILSQVFDFTVYFLHKEVAVLGEG